MNMEYNITSIYEWPNFRPQLPSKISPAQFKIEYSLSPPTIDFPKLSLKFLPKPTVRMGIGKIERMIWEKTRDCGKEQMFICNGEYATDIGCAQSANRAFCDFQQMSHFLDKYGKKAKTIFHYHTHPHQHPETGEPFTTITSPSSADLGLMEVLRNLTANCNADVKGRIVDKFGVWEYSLDSDKSEDSKQEYYITDEQARESLKRNAHLSHSQQARLLTSIYAASNFTVKFREHSFGNIL